MSKVRVHTLARELGIRSSEALARLNDMGEYVKGAASTVEPEIAEMLRSAVLQDRAAQTRDDAADGSGTVQ